MEGCRLFRAVACCIAIFLLSLAASQAQAPKNEKKADQEHAAQIDAAKKAAVDWLRLVDEDKYAESWKETASFLQAHFPEAAWRKRLDETRRPLDPVVNRSLSTTQFRDQFPGLPPGHYVALVWESYFGPRHQMLESVIMSDENGVWKPIGYAVQ